MQHESGEHERKHREGLDEHHSVANRLAFVERHHAFDAGCVVAQLLAEHQPAHPNEHDQQQCNYWSQVDDEVVEGEARTAGDDDVGRVADQGRGSTDVARHDLGDEEGHGIRTKPVANEQSHRRDQQHGRHVVEKGGEHRGDHDQHDEDHERAPTSPLGRPDGEKLKNAGLLKNADDNHHAEQQEDDVPVDTALLGEESVFVVARTDDDHQRGAHQRNGDARHLFGGDENVGGDKYREREADLQRHAPTPGTRSQ